MAGIITLIIDSDTYHITLSCADGHGKYRPNTLSPVCLNGMETGNIPLPIYQKTVLLWLNIECLWELVRILYGNLSGDTDI